jgi:mannose-6-phosphate isomerase-like protein (cupin superfamily)
MLIRDTRDCPYRRVMDRSVLCELLHPDRVGDAGALACSIAHAVVPAGESTLLHRLRTSYEVYFIIDGEGIMEVDGETAPVRDGQAVCIPPGATQRVINSGSTDLAFLCIVEPPWREEDEELV